MDEDNIDNSAAQEQVTLADEMRTRYLQTGSVLPSNDPTIDNIFRELGFGSNKSRLSALVYGFDHENIGTNFDLPKDEYGMVFFTKPRLNLSYDNMNMDRILAPLKNTNPLSVMRIVKAYLDPVEAIIGKRGSPLVDNNNPFITILSTTCTQLTGWPDLYAKTYTSRPGLYGQVWSKPDGVAKIYNDFPISATFNSGISDIVGEIFHKWVSYSLLVNEGAVDPYFDYIISNRMDFNTRIYVVVLDSTRQFVKKITCTGAAFPQFTNIGIDGNFSKESPLKEENQTVSIQFTGMGAFYRDYIAAFAFNRIVIDWMPSMHDKYRNTEMVKLKHPIKKQMNHIGYPRINPLTSEFEWWVRKEDYNLILKRGK